MKTFPNGRRFKALITVPLLLALTACSNTQIRPDALSMSYSDVVGMSQDEWDQRSQAGMATADRIKDYEIKKFLAGDPVHRTVGTLEIHAVFDPILQVGHFTFVNDPTGVDGEVTTTTLVVAVEDNGLVARNPKTGMAQTLIADLGRQPDVGRLIISKAGDILASASSGVLGVVANKKIKSCDDCGNGTGTVINTSASAGSLSEAKSLTGTDIDIRGGFKLR